MGDEVSSMAVKETPPGSEDGGLLPPADPALRHTIHMGPNWDRILRLRPDDLLKRRKRRKFPSDT
jgi:hypothetical protein